MNIAEQKLDLFHQIDELPEDLLEEVKKLIARLKTKRKVKQKSEDISDLGGFFKNNVMVLSDEGLCKPVDFAAETQQILDNFYNLPVSKIESIDKKSVYQGKPLSLEDMEQAIEYEAGLHK